MVLYQGARVAELQRFPQHGYAFRYLPAFRDMRLSPFPGSPLERGETLSHDLPAFFQERLPDKRRPEVQERIRQSGIAECKG